MKTRTLTKKARELRKQQTPSEVKMWALLRNKRLSNYKFYRQFPIGPYIVDFYCKSKNVVIEVDGGGHAIPEQIDKDRQRDYYLEQNGCTIVRIWSSEVESNIDGVAKQIIGKLEEN